MTGATITFLAFTAVAMLSLAAGYLARERGWMAEARSKPIHHFVVVWMWTGAFWLTTWKLQIELRHLWIIGIQFLAMLVGAAGGVVLGKLMRLPRPHIGVVAIGGAVCNIGFTLGAYLCYLMVPPKEQTLGFVGAAIATLSASMVLFVYPIAYAFSPKHTPGDSLGKLLYRSIFSLTSLPLLSLAVGAVLSALRVPYPRFVIEWHVVDAFVYAFTVLSFFGVGLGLRVAEPLRYGKQTLALSLVTFGAVPLVTWGVLLVAVRPDLGTGQMDPAAAQVMWLEAWMPAGMSTVMLANVFHLNGRMASSAWFWNTALFVVFILPIMLWLV